MAVAPRAGILPFISYNGTALLDYDPETAPFTFAPLGDIMLSLRIPSLSKTFYSFSSNVVSNLAKLV